MSSRGSRAAGMFFVVLLITNGALYGATTYLREYNPAHWVMVSEDYGKILLAEQYPGRLEADGVAFAEARQVELVGTPGILSPRQAEVWVDTVTGGRTKVYYGNRGMHEYAVDLSKRLDRPMIVSNYEAELKARENPLEAADGSAPAGSAEVGADGIPQLPGSR